MYLKAHDIESGEFDGCNENEIKELLCRKSLEDWLLDTPEARQELNQYLRNLSKDDTRLSEMMLKIAPIKNRAVSGTDTEATEHVYNDQNLLIDKMAQLMEKFEV